MLTPSPVSAKKNRIYGAVALLALAVCISGCAPPGPRALLKGKKFLERGDYANAVAQLQTATTALATNADAWNYYGVALQHAGQMDDAAAAYQNALKFDRDLVEAHYNLGCLWLEENKFADAKTEFTAYTLRRSNTPEGWLKLGMAQWRAADLLSAEKSFSTALSLSTNNPEALNGLGLCRVARNRPDDAAKFFAAAINAQPDFAPARLNLAIIDEQYLHDDKAALDNYLGYLTLMPQAENRDAVNARIAALESPAKMATANSSVPQENEIETPARPVESEPFVSSRSSEPPKVQPGRTLANPPQVVRVQSEPAIAGTPAQNPSTTTKTGGLRNLNPLNWFDSSPKEKYAENGVTLLPPANSNPRPAIKLVQPAPPVFPRYLYLSPRKPRAGDRKAASQFFDEARHSELQQQWSDAMDLYQKAATLDPGWFQAQYNYGVLAYRDGDFRRALAADEMALAVQPDSADTRYNFALALKSAGYALDAESELKKILAKDPNDARAHLVLGNLYAQQLRDPAQARGHYLRVLALDPRNPAAADIQFWLSANPP